MFISIIGKITAQGFFCVFPQTSLSSSDPSEQSIFWLHFLDKVKHSPFLKRNSQYFFSMLEGKTVWTHDDVKEPDEPLFEFQGWRFDSSKSEYESKFADFGVLIRLITLVFPEQIYVIEDDSQRDGRGNMRLINVWLSVVCANSISFTSLYIRPCLRSCS